MGKKLCCETSKIFVMTNIYENLKNNDGLYRMNAEGWYDIEVVSKLEYESIEIEDNSIVVEELDSRISNKARSVSITSSMSSLDETSSNNYIHKNLKCTSVHQNSDLIYTNNRCSLIAKKRCYEKANSAYDNNNFKQ